MTTKPTVAEMRELRRIVDAMRPLDRRWRFRIIRWMLARWHLDDRDSSWPT